MFKNKSFTITIVVVIIVCIVVLAGIFLTSGRGEDAVVQPLTNSEFIEADFRTTGDVSVTTKNFTESKGLELVLDAPIRDNSELLILGPQYIFFNRGGQLQAGSELLTEQRFTPSALYDSEGGIIVHHINSPVIINNDVVSLPQNVLSIVPFNGQYIYLEFLNSGDLGVYQTSSVTINQSQNELALITPQSRVDNAEVRIINNIPYVLIYDSLDRSNIEIWQLDNGNIRKIRDITNVESLRFLQNGILYTDQLTVESDLTPFKTNFLDLSTPDQPFIKELDITQVLAQNNIYGSVYASRCTSDGADLLYCVVKQSNIDPNFAQARDVLFTYDLETGKIEYPYPNLIFSAGNIYYKRGQLYITSQETGQLYTFQ